MNSLRTHQMQLIQSNKKPLFYCSFKMTQDVSVQMDLIKNLQHKQSVAKLRSGNHNLRIETGRHWVRSFGVIQIRISDPRSLRSWRIKETEKSLPRTFDVPWSEWSWITDPDLDHPKGTHPTVSQKFPKTLEHVNTVTVHLLILRTNCTLSLIVVSTATQEKIIWWYHF